jgi:serine/threonine protein phosphatase PrpC
MLTNEVILAILQKSSDIGKASHSLVSEALQLAGYDNITFIFVGISWRLSHMISLHLIYIYSML